MTNENALYGVVNVSLLADLQYIGLRGHLGDVNTRAYLHSSSYQGVLRHTRQ